MSDSGEGPSTLVELLEQLHGRADEVDDQLTVGEIVESFSGRAFGPLLALPGVAIVSPMGMVPTLPSLLGAVVVLIAAQRVFGKSHPWLPNSLADRSLSKERIHSSLDRFKPWAKRIDDWTSSRFRWLVEGSMRRWLAAVSIAAAITIPPLELVPGAAFLPGAAILMLGLAILANDGALAALAVAATIGGVGVVAYAFL